MVNWDPGLRTAISDLEVEQRTVEDTLYLVDYPLESGSGAVTVATVRPETMLADTAIAVNPNDERYSRLIGEAAILPLVGRRLPIVADEYVDPEFGTGALKITPGHDPNDFEIGRRHGLEEVTVIGEDGRITDAAPEQFRGMEVEEARAAVVAALREEGLVSGTRPYEHDVPHSHRSGRRIEPLISLQWFCDMSELAKPAVEAARDGRLRFHPERPWTGVYLDWLENIRPWCISRQLWWGHQLPVWYRGDETYVGAEPPEGEGWERDPDVLDTWFSSGLWPFATLGWPEDTPELRTFYPTDVLSTARDIIFLWVARMVMFGVELTGELPFTRRAHPLGGPGARRPPDVEVARHRHRSARPDRGRPAPAGLRGGRRVPAYGADALRFALMAMSSSQDVRFNEERVRQGRDLANKLWNASRLILLRVGDVDAGRRGGRDGRGPLDRVAARPPDRERHRAVRLVPLLVRRARAVRRLLVGALRLVPRARQAAALRGGQRRACPPCCCTRSSGSSLLLHPVMPFVTEEIWSLLPGERGLLAVAAWPEPDPSVARRRRRRRCSSASSRAVGALRSYRDEVGAKPGTALRGVLAAGRVRRAARPARAAGAVRAGGRRARMRSPSPSWTFPAAS